MLWASFLHSCKLYTSPEKGSSPIMSNMARKKKEEDKKVKTLREAVVELPQRKKVSLAVFVSISVTTLIFLFIFTLIDVVKPALITEEEYLALLPRLDDVDWAIRKGGAAGIALELKSFKPDRARTEKNGRVLLLILEKEGYEYVIRFSYRENRVMGFIGSTSYTLYYSSGKRDSNKVLSLVSKRQKITLYEE